MFAKPPTLLSAVAAIVLSYESPLLITCVTNKKALIPKGTKGIVSAVPPLLDKAAQDKAAHVVSLLFDNGNLPAHPTAPYSGSDSFSILHEVQAAASE
jgi:hypothetical protein